MEIQRVSDGLLRKPPSPTAHAFVPGPPFDELRTPPARVSNVNTTSIPAAVELACSAMGQVFNPADNGYSYMYTRIWPDGWLGFSPYHGAVQMSGRHLDALLAAEDALGVDLDEGVLAQHTAATFFSLGAGPLPCNHNEPGGALTSVDEHSIREAVHGLHALARYRASDRAVEAAEALIAEIRRFWRAESDWDQNAVQAAYGLPMTARPTFVEGVARSIGPLVKYYGATGSNAALELAQDLAAHATARFYLADGSYDAERLGAHTHSTTCTLSGLALLGSVTDDRELITRVRAFYDNGLRVIRDAVGWVRERHHPSFHPEQGEMNNVGDVIETALILGNYFGDTYFEDAERYLRSQLLPSQVRDLSFMDEVPGGDERCDLRTRLLGLFGFNAVYGHLPLGKTRSPRALTSSRRDCLALRRAAGDFAHQRRRNSGQHAVRLRERRGSYRVRHTRRARCALRPRLTWRFACAFRPGRTWTGRRRSTETLPSGSLSRGESRFVIRRLGVRWR